MATSNPEPQSFQAAAATAAVLPPMTLASIKPATNFSAEADSNELRRAMQGLGTKESVIINILTTRSNAQRQEIKYRYKTHFGRDLLQDLHSELSGKFRTTILALMDTRAAYDARCLHKAVKGLGTDEKVLIEILCSRTNQEIRDIITAYRSEFGRELEADISGDTSFAFKGLLVSLLQANREESLTVSIDRAKKDAQELFKAGIQKWGTDESKFNVIMVTRSYPQLRVTFDEYTKLAQKDIFASIETEFSGDVKEAFKALAQCIINRSAFFAEKLYKSMKGMGTDDNTLIRICVSRSEVDMVDIRQKFVEAYRKTLWQMIDEETSGDYRTTLKAVVGAN